MENGEVICRNVKSHKIKLLSNMITFSYIKHLIADCMIYLFVIFISIFKLELISKLISLQDGKLLHLIEQTSYYKIIMANLYTQHIHIII